jgi:VWFA-related protein
VNARSFRLLSFIPLFFAGPSIAQVASGDSSRQPLVLHSYARTVVVAISVTDEKDAPVTGLKKEDFRLFERGNPQQITFFEEHPGATVPPRKPLPAMPANVFTNYQVTEPTDSIVALLIDSLNTPLEDQSYMHSQAIRYLKTLPPGTQVAIFTLSEHLGFVQGFTNDPKVLLAALGDKNAKAGPQASPVLQTRAE